MKLKRCPLCNGKVKMDFDDLDSSYFIECLNYFDTKKFQGIICGLKLEGVDKDILAEIWNTRAKEVRE